jgi:hypothetical protein
MSDPVHPQNVWWEISEQQIPKLLEIIREQRVEIAALKARLAPKPPNPELAARGRDLIRWSLQGKSQ